MFTRSQALCVLGACAVSGLAQAERIDQRLTVEPRGTVEISNVAGKIEVSGWDNPQVEVQGETGGGVERVDFNTDHGHTIIKVRVPGGFNLRSASADLRIRVPRDSEVEISGVSADVSVGDVAGRMSTKTVSGNVRADVFEQSSEVKTVSGDVSLRGKAKEGSPGAEIRVSTISGSIHIDRSGGDVEVTTVSGDVNLRLQPSRSVRMRSTSGELALEGKLVKGASVDGETVSGDLSVRTSHEGSLEYQVNTFSGDISNCMGMQAERVSKYGPGSRLNGTLGGSTGDSRIRLKTMSGDVELCDKG